MEVTGAGVGSGITRREFLLASAGVLLLGGCGSDSGAAEGEITVWTWPDNDKTFEKTVPIFEKKFPNIKVKVQAFEGGDPYHSKLLASLVSGTGPDVAMVEISYVAKFKSKPGFVDLAGDYSAEKFSGKYADFSWSYVSDQQEGRIFALPKNTGPGGMFYRRDLFEEAGLPTEPDQVNELLKTWDDYLSVGEKLSKENKQWMTDAPESVFQTIRSQAGVSYFDENGNLQVKNQVFTEALEYARRAEEAGLASPFTPFDQEWVASFKNGNIATYFYGNWLGGLIKSVYAPDTGGTWGVTFAPEFEGESAYNSGGDFIGILESSQNKPAAWEWIKFVTQDPDSLKKMYAANDLYPAWQPVLDAKWINDEDPFYSGQNVNEVFSPVSKRMEPPVTNPNDAVAETAMVAAVTDVVEGEASVEEALDAAEKQIRADSE
jgi:ABC-type glycerol-3-phosphate transport system substrate-binding protein